MKGRRVRKLQILNRRANAYILSHPLGFVWQTLKGFKANQGLLLAGAVAYYALLSIVPFLMLVVVALSHFIDQAELLSTLSRYLEWLVPGQSRAIVGELSHFLEDRDLVTWVLFAIMLFFSSLAFTALENAMCVIFHHRVAIRRRRFLISAILPQLKTRADAVMADLTKLGEIKADALKQQEQLEPLHWIYTLRRYRAISISR